MIRSASKNWRDVAVVTDQRLYSEIVEELNANNGALSLETRQRLATLAYTRTASYDLAISSYLARQLTDEDLEKLEPLNPLGSLMFIDPDDESEANEGAEQFPEDLHIELAKVADLRYGENPHQKAAWYAEEPATGLGNAQVLQGKELSYTNLLDLDAAARIVLEFDEPAAAVIKHTNPCGAATGANAVDAYIRARDADSLAAFGGIVGLNRAIDAETAKAIVSTFIEAVVAPAVADDARAILATKANLRIVTAEFGSLAQDSGRELRSILGAVLMQSRDRVVEAARPWPSGDLKVVTKRQPSDGEWQALRFAWRICAHIKSNTILFTSADRTLAIGAGQMSRVDAAKVARMKAEATGVDALKGSVAASDAFFPFRDGLDAVADAGATAVVQPGGSVRDQEVIAAADERGVAMVFTGRRHFRH